MNVNDKKDIKDKNKNIKKREGIKNRIKNNVKEKNKRDILIKFIGRDRNRNKSCDNNWWIS
jgi:hypothetical protein